MTPPAFMRHLKRPRFGRGIWPALLVLVGMGQAQPTNPPPANAPPANAPEPARGRADPVARNRRVDYSAFRLIAERNIFNAARSGGRVNAPPRETRRPARTDTLALVGVMSYEKGAFAFFDGSQPEFRKALAPGGTIAEFKLAEIRPDGVGLENGTNRWELRVGTRLRREDQGPWQLSDSTESLTPAPAGGTTSAGTAESSNGGAADEVLRRLLQRREQESR